jgi:hypothetical protein
VIDDVLNISDSGYRCKMYPIGIKRSRISGKARQGEKTRLVSAEQKF